MREGKVSIAYLSATNAAYLGKANVEQCNIMLHCAVCFIPQHIYEDRPAALGCTSLLADTIAGAMLCIRFFEHLAHCLVGYGVDKTHLDHLLRQQPQGPAGVALWGRCTRYRNYACFLLGVQLALRPRAGVLVEGPEVCLNKTLPHAPDGRCPHSQCYS